MQRPTSDPISQASLRPWKGDFRSPKQVGLPADDVYFENPSGHRLRGWLFTSNEATQTILFCMGNSGNISLMLPYAKILQDVGFEVLLFDYQGFGNSEGIASLSSLTGDTTAAFDFLVNSRQRKPADIGVFGVSLGSLLALTVAVEKNAGAVALEDSFIPQEQIDRLAARYVGDDDSMSQLAIATLKALFLTRVDPLQNVKKLKVPLFLLHGENDWLLPPSGTLKIAKACPGPKRVWLMQSTGHAPESLEVNDDEYASQLQTFFRQAFQHKLDEPKLAMETVHKAPRTWTVNVAIDCGETPSKKVPIQLALADERGRRVFQNELIAGPRQVSVTTKFLPTHVSVVQFHNTTNSADSWRPKLSVFSRALQEYRHAAHHVFRSERSSEYFCFNRGVNFYTGRRYLGRFPDRSAADLLKNLPPPDSLPERIKARYAALLARIDRWPRPDTRNAEPQTTPTAFARKMLDYLPKHPDDYYEIGNARFHLKFRDAVVAHSLYELARHRLIAGKPAEAQNLLRMHVATLPETTPTNLTPERIASIRVLDDLQDKPVPTN